MKRYLVIRNVFSPEDVPEKFDDWVADTANSKSSRVQYIRNDDTQPTPRGKRVQIYL